MGWRRDEDDDRVYTPEQQKLIRRLEEEIRVISEKAQEKEDQIRQIKVSHNPIQPGCVIEWESGTKIRRGLVLTVQPEDYRGHHSYRCQVLGVRGQPIGFANITDEKCPVIVETASKRKKAKNERIARAYGASERTAKRASK